MKKKVLHEEIAIFDSMSGVYSKSFLYEMASKLWAVRDRASLEIVVAVFNIDNLASINEQYGNTVGDKVIVEFANILKNRFRVSDTVARMDGDEFCVVAINMNRMQTHNVLSSVQALIDEAKIKVSSKKTIGFDVSIGFSTDFDDTLENTIKIATDKMQVSKRIKKSALSN